MKFIDLFSGLGGFHLALSRLGHECVFACEINPELRKVYKANFGIEPAPDIRDVDLKSIPDHDILCAGFPCQPFSTAGLKLGLNCPRNGTLIEFVASAIATKRPRYFMLENVKGLLGNDKGRTFRTIMDSLARLGYYIRYAVLSPHEIGVPQYRPRVFIVGDREDPSGVTWPLTSLSPGNLDDYLGDPGPDITPMGATMIRALEAWTELVAIVSKDREWSNGILLRSIFDRPDDEALHADLVRKGWCTLLRIATLRSILRRNEWAIKRWVRRTGDLSSIYTKLEWHCTCPDTSLKAHLVHVRASGIRVLQKGLHPTITACGPSRTPAIPLEERHVSPVEVARLQGFETLEHLPESVGARYRAIGNAVNVHLIEEIGRGLGGGPSGLFA